MRQKAWIIPQRIYGKGRQLPSVTFRFPSPFLRALKKYAGLESERHQRKVAMSVILMTHALEANAELLRLYKQEGGSLEATRGRSEKP